jgi:2-oxoglutarate ferredoxin oxidoreductase subunit delta
MAKKGELILNTAWCKGCGICAAFCPKKVLEIVEEKAVIKNEDSCIFCGQCEQRCPDYAIYLKEYEMSEMGVGQWVRQY